MKKNIKFYAILLLLLINIGLITYGVVFAVRNYNRGEIMTLNTNDLKLTIERNQLDNVNLPTVNLPLIYKTFPKAK